MDTRPVVSHAKEVAFRPPRHTHSTLQPIIPPFLMVRQCAREKAKPPRSTVYSETANPHYCGTPGRGCLQVIAKRMISRPLWFDLRPGWEIVTALTPPRSENGRTGVRQAGTSVSLPGGVRPIIYREAASVVRFSYKPGMGI